jgi:phosphohistidine phosphatase SixA
MYTLILVFSIIIAINIAATVLHHLLDPDTMRRQAEEEAESEIEDHTLELVKKGAKVLAAKTAPQLAAAWVGELEARYASVIVASKTRTKKATEGITAQLPPDSGTDQSTLPLMASTVPLNPTNRRKS